MDSSAFAAAVRHAGRILDRLDPARNRITIQADDGRLTVGADGAQTVSRVTIPATVLDAGAVAVCGTWLLALAAQSGAGESMIDADGEGGLTLTTGRRVATMRTLTDDTAAPVMRGDGPDDIVLSFPAGTLARLSDATGHCASRTRTTPILSGIHLHGDGRTISAESTDKYRAARIRIPQPGWEGSLTVGAEWFRGAARHADTLRIRRTRHAGGDTPQPSSLAVSGPGFTDESALLAGDWPNLSRVMPERDTAAATEIRADRAALLAAVKYLRALDTDESDMVPIRLAWGADGLSVSHSGDDSTGRDTIEDASIDGDTATLPAFNAPYLQDALQTIGSQRVVIRANGDRKPAMILADGDDEDWVQVIVPIRHD
ncbi:DNA polymerase III subunit beta [Bifidobacterium castoris]|nr:DNA polymerase III subunit beta [Bifidobacterium castoris]